MDRETAYKNYITQRINIDAAAGVPARLIGRAAENNSELHRSPISDAMQSVFTQRNISHEISADGRFVKIYGDDGEYILTVTKGIKVTDLLSVLGYGERMFSKGRRIGEENIQGRLSDIVGFTGK